MIEITHRYRCRLRAFSRGVRRVTGVGVCCVWAMACASCAVIIAGGGGADDDSTYNNTTDSTNKGAEYIGSNACRSCHASVGGNHRLHAHANALTPIDGRPPTYLGTSEQADISSPPAGYEWTDVSYMLAGYLRGAYFIDTDGFFISEGAGGEETLWRLPYMPLDASAGFVPYPEGAELSSDFDYSCFKCHTTGAKPQDAEQPAFQENRPGMAGTFQEAGVQCEACHGPGSNHPPRPQAREMYVDSSAAACGKCHTHGGDPNIIASHDGFIFNNAQYPELLASGGHSAFSCTTCHDPHVSPNYDNSNAIRNDCTDCHATQNMALHEGIVFERGDYVEALTCRSCHMPYGGVAVSGASADVVGDLAHVGDTRTHIFRIDADRTNFAQMFTADGAAVVKDDQGRAAVTLDMVCLRCHNGIGSAPSLGNLTILSGVASGIHEKLLSETVKSMRTQWSANGSNSIGQGK